MCDAFTSEDPDLSEEIIAGFVDVDAQGGVVVDHRQAEGTIEDHFFELCIPILTDAAKNQEEDIVESIAIETITRRGLHRELDGSGLAFDISCEYRLNGTRVMGVWLRSRVNTRRTCPSSPVHWMELC